MIKLYSAEWCGQCNQLKDMLFQKGISYEVIDVDEQPEHMDGLIRQGIRGLPVMDVDGELYVGIRGAMEYFDASNH